MSEETKQKFHQSTLALLASGEGSKQVMENIIAHSTITAGFRREEGMGGPAHVIIHLQNMGKVFPAGFDAGDSLHRAWALGKMVVEWSWHDSYQHCIRLYKEAKKFLDAFGKSPFFRVSSQLVGEVVQEEFSFREFCILCSLYAVIGEKQYCIVRRDRIRAGALGYSSAKALFDRDGNITSDGAKLLLKRRDVQKPLSLDQCRYTLDKLHDRKFFSRIQPLGKGRDVYYSRNLNHDELSEYVLKKIDPRGIAANQQTGAQRKMKEKYDALIIAGNSRVKDVPAESPQVPQSFPATIPANVPASIPATVPAIINSSHKFPLIDSCNECSLIAGERSPSEIEKPPEPKKFEPGHLMREFEAAVEAEKATQ